MHRMTARVIPTIYDTVLRSVLDVGDDIDTSIVAMGSCIIFPRCIVFVVPGAGDARKLSGRFRLPLAIAGVG